MLHWFPYWFWRHFSVVSRFPWGEGKWTLLDVCFYSSLPPMAGRGCLLLFFFHFFFFLFLSSLLAGCQSVSVIFDVDAVCRTGRTLFTFMKQASDLFETCNAYVGGGGGFVHVIAAWLEVSCREYMVVCTLVGSECPPKSPSVAGASPYPFRDSVFLLCARCSWAEMLQNGEMLKCERSHTCCVSSLV